VSNDNHKIFRECGTGWERLIAPLIKRCTELGGTVEQVKEKFGRLRFYYYPGEPGTDAQWEAFEDAVNQACTDSGHTCEMCGKRGLLMIKGRWYKTLCAEHSKDLGYKDKA
jgi:hypothetical protein